MKLKFHIAALLSFLAVGSTQAQEFSLPQLLELAMKNDFSIQSARLDERKTNAKIDEVKSALLPSVNVSGDYKRYFKIPGQVVPASAFGGPEGQYSTLAFGLPYNLSTTAQVTQNLYNPSIKYALKAANLNRELTSLSTVKTKEDVAYNVTDAYYNLVTVVQQMAFLDSNLISLDRMYKVSDLLYQNKLGQRVDVDRILINKTTTETQLETLKDNYNQLVNLLKYYTGTPQSEQMRIAVSVSDVSLPAQSQDAELKRTDVALLQKQRDLNELQDKNIKSGFIPTVNAYGTANMAFYAKAGENSTFQDVPGYWAGLQLNWNVFDGMARRAKRSQNQIDNEKLNVQLRQVKESIAMEEANARNKFAVEQRNINARKDQVALAERVYKQIQLQFKEGTVSLTDVIQAENSNLDAQSNYLTSLVQLLKAELEWKKATGSLIQK
ncbi:TolC family protein [Dyadobacter sp. CY107]|uniref:TolC family protein n=1 Tax=Dyadobacter fanqingshengii TaxID=2906443 RepID=UPI001F283B2D|nr:TolC family protein [Dyadobacter fanqingshengii]MCF2504517.1 TolC family protein [Dyadobacter fanqingshengii]